MKYGQPTWWIRHTPTLNNIVHEWRRFSCVYVIGVVHSEQETCLGWRLDVYDRVVSRQRLREGNVVVGAAAIFTVNLHGRVVCVQFGKFRIQLISRGLRVVLHRPHGDATSFRLCFHDIFLPVILQGLLRRAPKQRIRAHSVEEPYPAEQWHSV